jgi:hypothetical protein
MQGPDPAVLRAVLRVSGRDDMLQIGKNLGQGAATVHGMASQPIGDAVPAYRGFAALVWRACGYNPELPTSAVRQAGGYLNPDVGLAMLLRRPSKPAVQRLLAGECRTSGPAEGHHDM